MTYGMAGMPGNQRQIGAPKDLGKFPVVGNGLGGLPVRVITPAAPKVSDVFSAKTYLGDSSTQTITNGINLLGVGGLTWFKSRINTNSVYHYLLDTVRGGSYYLSSNTDFSEAGGATYISSFNSNGFVLSPDGNLNGTGDNYVSWTFRKHARFFDFGTYTGSGLARRIAHSLGVVPGMVIVKATNKTAGWWVKHRSLTDLALLQSANAFNNSSSTLISSMSEASFTIETDVNVNGNGDSFVWYAFAHDTSSSGVIQCLSFTTDGSGNASIAHRWSSGVQFAMLKSASLTGDWEMFDTTRTPAWASGDARLRANLLNPEDSVSRISAADGVLNVAGLSSNSTYVCLLIKAP